MTLRAFLMRLVWLGIVPLIALAASPLAGDPSRQGEPARYSDQAEP